MTEVVAIHMIYRNPHGAMRATGEFDSSGMPLMQADPQVIQPGGTFEVGEDEMADLLSRGAIRPLSEAEIAFRKLGQ